MSLVVDDLKAAIRATKRRLKAQIADPRRLFAEVEDDLRREVEEILEARAQVRPVIPSVDYAAVRSRAVGQSVTQEIRRRGVAVVRGVFSDAQATAWNEAIGEYATRSSPPIHPSISISASCGPAGRRSSASTGRSRRWKRASIRPSRRPGPS